MASCEKCWRDAALEAFHAGTDQATEYRILLRRREEIGPKCSAQDQAGPDATWCSRCGLRTVHQHAKVCMNCGDGGHRR